MSFIDGKQFTVTDKMLATYKRLKKRFDCLLCGLTFQQGDVARFIMANNGSEFKYDNFFVCMYCDAGNCTNEDNPIILRRATAKAAELKKLQELVNRLAEYRE